MYIRKFFILKIKQKLNAYYLIIIIYKIKSENKNKFHFISIFLANFKFLFYSLILSARILIALSPADRQLSLIYKV